MKMTKLAALLGMMTLATTAHAKEVLTVYTAFETDIMGPYQQAFEQAHPDIEIKWVRDSTGVITAKLLAEKARPQADVVWGLAGSSLALLKQEGVIKPYLPAGAEALDPGLRDPQANPAWYGNDAFFNAVCFNEAMGKSLGIPAPTSWEDLLKPEFKGRIAMPNPASSGTGFMMVAAWLQSLGDDKGWAYMEKLHGNIVQYTHSGSKPCVQAAQGEVLAGISMSLRGAKLKTQGAPISVILPKGGIGWDTESVALVNEGSAAAKTLVDWSIGESANRLYSQNYPVVGIAALSKPVPNYPDVKQAMIPLDFAKMARERAQILADWSNRFDGKSEAQ
ncbi:putative 2-aminoethylphosphonate ABC transporter substrate-binding protein [Aeromonas bivalvium]|uniref:putative 2-aminoethylphosphonate ABC transporter substrate-binding protein n=1 Tax=Aeromonas bivalvium TaxID=440079 RepID=UPI00370C338A